MLKLREKMNRIILLLLIPFSVIAHESKEPPELWSWYKNMNVSSEACKIQSSFILEKIGVKNVVLNEHGVYGAFQSNRIVVKCLAKEKNSMLWVAVAGTDRDSVELIRNKIIADVN